MDFRELGIHDREGKPITSMERFALLLADVEYKVVKQEHVGPYWVSTIWVGIDYNFGMGGPPLIFETMVFGDTDDLSMDLDCHRWTTEQHAREGHEEIVTLIRATMQEADLKPPADGP